MKATAVDNSFEGRLCAVQVTLEILPLSYQEPPSRPQRWRRGAEPLRMQTIDGSQRL